MLTFVSENFDHIRLRLVRRRHHGHFPRLLPRRLTHAPVGVGQSQSQSVPGTMLVLMGHSGRVASFPGFRYVEYFHYWSRDRRPVELLYRGCLLYTSDAADE